MGPETISIDKYLGINWNSNVNYTDKYVHVLFRKLVREIPSTTYVTHGLYYYPAKFIPHVIRYVIKKYTKKGDWVFDPFAGSGSVSIECHLLGRNYILWDLNPILNVLVKASTYMEDVSNNDLMIDLTYSREFLPRWNNLLYWHPEEFLEVLAKAWGYYHDIVPDKLKPLVAIPLLKVTRYFSYSDEKVAKLYKSKRAVKKVKKLLNSNWKELMFKMYKKEVKKLVSKIKEFQRYRSIMVESIVYAGIDSLRGRLDRETDILLTSPPYLQAQEYIRSFKLELFWLGYSEEDIRKLQKLEIPYREPPAVKVESRLYREYRKKVMELGRSKLLAIYDSYFKSLALFFNNNHELIKRYMAIFVGPVKIRGVRIPIDEILREHLESLGWKHEVTLIDKIVSRKLFETKINPATGLPDERTPTEHLLIMKKDR